MSLWKKGIEKSKTGQTIDDEFPEGNSAIEEPVKSQADEKEEKTKQVNIAEIFREIEEEERNDNSVRVKNIDWEERHFQICLALLGRQDLSALNPNAIIRRADKFIAELKKRYRED